ncbi:LacI family transcriptional regulator [bacterium]|nr:LacI family transcriptional regulator [bacterium]
MANQPGMKQIADIVGVSVTTVSRALNNPEMLKAETRWKILQAFEEQGYIYNSVAGDLVRQKSTIIGVLLPNAKTPLFASALLGIQDCLQESGYSIIAGNSKYDDEIENKLLMQFHQRQVAGIIRAGFGYNAAKFKQWLKGYDIPCVILLEKLENSELSYVGFDNYQASLAMMNYLLSLRHRRIGLIIGPFSRTERVQKRFLGYRAALAAAGLDFDPQIVIETETGLRDGADAFQKLMSRPDPPTAVFAAGDYMALGALRAAHENGLKVPDDISIAGFGDIDVAAFSNPPLTTVRVPSYQCAYKGTEVLLKMIKEGGQTQHQYSLDTDLIIRSSCREI